jgi:hypothetical protein
MATISEFARLNSILFVVFPAFGTIYSMRQVNAATWNPPDMTEQSSGATPAIRPEFPPMTTRTTSRTVTFSRPFTLSGIGAVQPAGTYTVETDEELVQEISFPVYRRTATLMLLPSQPGSVTLAQIATIDPLELEVALERDAMKGMA